LLLSEFLRPSDLTKTNGVSALVQADYFIGQDEARQQHRALQPRLSLLEQHLRAAAELPITINHGDLRPPNAVVATDGRCVILDWDDAVVGPAGMSLHGLFSGCALPTILLSASAAAKAAAGTPNGLLVHAYMEALVANGYCDAATLKRALPAAMCAGMIQFMLNFGRFPGESARQDVRATLLGRLSDLFDVCDLLASRDPQTALAMAQDYETFGNLQRAQLLLQDHVLRHPGDTETSIHLGALLRTRGNLEQATHTYRQALLHAPNSGHLHAGLGASLMVQLDVEPATAALKQAILSDPQLKEAKDNLQRVLAIGQAMADAAQPHRVPTLHLQTAAAAAADLLRPEDIALGVKLFKTYGTLQIDNAFAADKIASLHDAFMQRYSPYFCEDNHPDALQLGDKRYMLTIDLEAPFDDLAIVTAPLVLPIIRQVLGDDCVLGAYTAVISLPGSQDQRLHKDHPALFDDPEWHHTLPCFAAQMIIPLVPLNEMTGTTRVYKGSHKIPTDQAEENGAQDPLVHLGSCLLTDYRCAHRGLGNRSLQVRPILTLIFNRPWFRDYKNYGKQPPLRFSDATYEQMPDNFKRLVSWWKEERMHNVVTRSALR
jgi:tetratricopeptide (TPR) repeat protein